MNNKEKLNTAWFSNLIAQSSGFIFFLIATPYLINALGKSTYGCLSLLYIIPQIAVQLDLGLIATGTRVIAINKSKPEIQTRLFWELICTLFLVGLVQVWIFTVVAPRLLDSLQIASILMDNIQEVIFVTALWIFVSILGAGFSIFARAYERYRLLALVQVLSVSGFWVGAVVIVMFHPQILYILWNGVLISLITSLLMLFIVREKLKLPVNELIKVNNSPILKDYLKFSMGAFVGQSSSLLTYHIDKFLVSSLVSPAAVGIYSICANIASKLLVFVSAIATFSFPRAASLHAQDSKDKIAEMYFRATKMCVFVALMLGVPLSGLSEPFLRLWLAENFQPEYALVMKVMVLGYIFASFSVVASNVSVGIGRSWMPACYALIGGCTTLILCFVLAANYGLYGAVGASVLGMTQAVIFNWKVSKYFGNSFSEMTSQLVIKVIVIWAGLSFLFSSLSYYITSWMNLIVCGFFAAVCTLVISFLLGYFSVDEKDALIANMRKIKWW